MVLDGDEWFRIVFQKQRRPDNVLGVLSLVLATLPKLKYFIFIEMRVARREELYNYLKILKKHLKAVLGQEKKTGRIVKLDPREFCIYIIEQDSWTAKTIFLRPKT